MATVRPTAAELFSEIVDREDRDQVDEEVGAHVVDHDHPLIIHPLVDVGVEVHSMSKGYDMIGWRMGFVCGHPKIVSAFADVKDNSDSGQFIATQKAAAAASAKAASVFPKFTTAVLKFSTFKKYM